MNQQEKSSLVAHTGFEPVISSLRGRCPKPLDECATNYTAIKYSPRFTTELLKQFIISRLQGASTRSIIKLITIP